MRPRGSQCHCALGPGGHRARTLLCLRGCGRQLDAPDGGEPRGSDEGADTVDAERVVADAVVAAADQEREPEGGVELQPRAGHHIHGEQQQRGRADRTERAERASAATARPARLPPPRASRRPSSRTATRRGAPSATTEPGSPGTSRAGPRPPLPRRCASTGRDDGGVLRLRPRRAGPGGRTPARRRPRSR